MKRRVWVKTPMSISMYIKIVPTCGMFQILGSFATRGIVRVSMSAGEVGAKSRPPKATELYAAGRVIGFKCFDPNLDFLKCKNGDKDPSACVGEGEKVHECVYGLFKEIAGKAPQEFSALASCLDTHDLRTHRCKKYQDAFEAAYYKA